MAGDDCAGLEVLRCLEAQGPRDCDLRSFHYAGIEILEIFDEADVILFVDAVSSGAPAGSLHLISLPSSDVRPRMLQSISGHGWSLLETSNLARALGRRVPKIILLGIELEGAIPGATRSAAVNEAIDRVVEGFSVVESWLRGLSASDLPVSRVFSPSDDSFPKNLMRNGSETRMPPTAGIALEKTGSGDADVASVVS